MTATLHALGCGSSAGTYYTDDLSREARPKSRDNYYTHDGGGTWWATGNSIVRHGAPVDKETFRDLCGGFDPRTGKALVRGAGEGHRAGWDITFSTPKSFGILWAAGTAEQRAVLEKIQNDAVDQALQFIIDEGLVEVRLGAGGRVREAPAEIMVAKFPHFTSREGDPACHIHSVLISAARAANSGSAAKYYCLEPKRLYEWQLVLGAAFRTALSERLVKAGLSLRPAGKDQVEIEAIPEAMLECFSKRAQQIKAFARPDASVAEKEVAALATRRGKASVPTGAELEVRWQKELGAFANDPWKVALEAGKHRQRQQTTEIDYGLNPPEIAGNTCVALAASTVLRTESVMSRKGLLHRSFVEASLQGQAIKTVYGEISDLEAAGKLVRLDQHKAGQHWTTAAIAEEEARLLRLVQERPHGSWFRPEAVEAVLQAASYLSDEQRTAIRHAASSEPTCILEAGAGTGKTTLIRGVVDIARKSGVRTIIGLAPSHVAADELARSAGIDAIVIARFRHEIATGQRSVPDANTLIIIDEAGMVGVRDMAAIFEAATIRTAAGTPARSPKILLSGDRRQLASVAGGNVLKAIADFFERKATLTGVRRQTVDWQRAASVAMAQGDSEAGLRVYAEHGRIDLVADREAARARTIEAWRELRRTYGDDVLVVTRRNRDAVALNLLARNILCNEGLIRGEEIALPSVDRDGDKTTLPVAIGDRIRFGETLHRHKIRNGTRGRIEGYAKRSGGSVHLAIRLEDGRLIEDSWSSFAQKRRRRHAGIPKIVHAVAGSVYSVQGRTSSATVHHIASATDARETYVSLTRHRHDVRIVVESERLESVCRARQEDPRMAATRSQLLERLFQESRRYHEKANVIDHVEDRMRFIATGQVELPRPQGRLNIEVAAEAARRVELAAQYIGEQRRGFTARMHQLAMSVFSDRRMPEGVKNIIEKVRSWTRSGEFRRTCDRDSVVHEYAR